MEKSSYRKGFIPFAIAAAVLSLCGGFTAAAPTAIATSWGLGGTGTTWITLAFALSAAGMAPIMGKFGDLMGRRVGILTGLALMAVGEFMIGMAPDGAFAFVLVARFILGTGAAVIALFLPQGLMQSCMTNTIIFVISTQGNTTLSGIAPSLMYVGMSIGSIVIGTMAELLMDLFPEKVAFLEDGVRMLDDGSISFISTAGFGCPGKTTADILFHPQKYEGRLMVRPCEISNHPEVIRRLGLLAMNNIVEADLCGNINSTHVNGTNIISGIGGALDFVQNARLTCYFTRSTAKTEPCPALCPAALTWILPSMRSM